MLGDHQEINVDSADTFSNLDVTILSAFSHNPVAYLYGAVILPVALNLLSSFFFDPLQMPLWIFLSIDVNWIHLSLIYFAIFFRVDYDQDWSKKKKINC